MKKLILISSLSLGFIVSTGIFVLANTTNDTGKDIENLEKTFPIIRDKSIAFFRNSDWCNVIKSPRGNYTNNLGVNCTWNIKKKDNFFNFDEVAKQDFKEVQQQLNRPKIFLLEVNFNKTGEIESARFDVESSDVAPICKVVWSCDRKTYVYQPNHGNVLPEAIPGELWYEPVNRDWYIEWQDWN
ncbi:MAG TPA: hypothetical protein V6D50_00665 [Chroococcales cyanobacterium]